MVGNSGRVQIGTQGSITGSVQAAQTSLLAGGTLQLNGGSLTTGTFTGNGGFGITAGKFNLTEQDLVLGSATPFSSNFNVQHATVNVTKGISVPAGTTLGLATTTLGAATLDNAGTTNITGMGPSSISAAVTNTGAIDVSATNGSLNFKGSVVNNGQIDVAAGSQAVYAGSVKGSGTFSGAGTHEFASYYSPGNSPFHTTFGAETNVVFDPTSHLSLEVFGDQPDQQDQATFLGNVSFGGAIDVIFSDGFAPVAGDTYNLLDTSAATVSGQPTVEILGLAAGFEYTTSFDNGLLTLTATNDGTYTGQSSGGGFVPSSPEPASAILTSACGVLLLARNRQRRR